MNAVFPDTVVVSVHGSGASVTEIQQLVLTSNLPTVPGATGLFQLAFRNQGVTTTTPCLAFGIAAADLQTALNSLANVNSGHVVVTRTGDGTAAWGYGYVYQIAFSGNLHVGLSNVLGNVNQLVVFSVGQGTCSPLTTGIPSIQVSTLREGQPGYAYDVFFVGGSYGLVAPLAIVTEGTCVLPIQWTVVGGSARRVQEILVQNPATAITGTPSYKLTFNGVTTTACVTVNAAPAAGATAIQTALNGLSSIGANGVLVTQDIDPIRAPNGYIARVTFVGAAVAGNVPLLAVSMATCTAFASPSSSVTINEAQRGAGAGNELTLSTKYTGDTLGAMVVAYAVSQTFRVLDELFQVDEVVVQNPNNDIPGGASTYTLGFGGPTATLTWNALDTDMETAFATSLGVAGVTVTRRTDSAVAPGGFVYTIYYVQSIGSVGTLVATETFTTATVTATNIRTGTNTNLFSPTLVPLALATDSTTATSFLGGGTGLSVFKPNGFLWSVLFDSNIGDVPALIGATTSTAAPLQVFDNFVQGSPSSAYTATNLVPGTPYFMRVSASTAIGQSPFSAANTIVPSSVPNAPQNFKAGYDLFANEIQVVKTAAKHVLEVQQVTTTAAVISEVQTLTTTATQCSLCIAGNIAFRQPTVQVITVSALGPIVGSGTFQLVFTDTVANAVPNGQLTYPTYATAPIAWNALAQTLKTALTALAPFTASDLVVTRTGDASVNFKYGYVFAITFVGNRYAGEVLPLRIQDVTTAATVACPACTACAACTAITTLGNVGYTLAQSQN
ncbi:hypothetical protein As57867_019611, partial [Aphanomyces stellatus]